MKVVQALGKIDMEFNGYKLSIKQGEKFLFANDVFNLLPPNIQSAFKEVKEELPPFYEGENLKGKTLLVIMQGAIGDVLCSTVALREIKRRYPNMTLWVSVSGRARPVLENLPYIDKLLSMPIPFKHVKSADYIVKVVEMVGTPQFDNLNMAEYFLWKFHLYTAEDETPDVYVDQKVVEELKPIFEKAKELSGRDKILLFHYLASSVHRTLPPKLLKEIEDLIWEEYAPIICSLPEEDITVETALDVYNIRAGNLSQYMKDIRYLIASVYLSDAVITTDTATLHIAGGLKKPTVLVSGPINPEFTARTYKTVIPVLANYKGQTCKAPCMIHAIGEPCPEAKLKHTFYSPCLLEIPPKAVYYALKDAELISQEDHPRPERCPVCDFEGDIPLFEVINGHRIFECPSCGLQFTYPMKTMDYDKAHSGEYGDLLELTEMSYESFMNVGNEKQEIENWSRLPRFNVLLPILSTLPRGKLLDVGCSTGFFLLIARKLGHDTYGMDASEKAIELARKKYKLKVVRALTFEDLPEEFKQPYDYITAFEVLEHVPDPMAFLKSVYELLREGGMFIMSCPPFYKFENTALGYRKYKWWYGDYPPNHVTRWKYWTLHYALKKAGFKEVHIFTEPFLPGTLLEGIYPTKSFTVPVDVNGQTANLNITPEWTSKILINYATPLYINSRTLGNFQCAIVVKGQAKVNLEELIGRAIRMSAVEIIWGKGNNP